MLRRTLGFFRYRRQYAVAALSRVRPRNWPGLVEAYRSSHRGAHGLSSIVVSGDPSPFVIRHGTSDFDVFCQVILLEQYRSVLPLENVRTIIDAGANVGYTSRYFALRFPRARLLAIEPDEDNVAALRANLAPLGDRCEVIHGAVWPARGQVSVLRGRFRDGREWATQVGEGSPGAAQAPALTMRDLIARAGEPVDLLKMDIEGAETQVLLADPDFMQSVRCCAIELHSDDAVHAFQRACDRLGFSRRVAGEITIAMRSR